LTVLLDDSELSLEVLESKVEQDRYLKLVSVLEELLLLESEDESELVL
jgi:hypothetical protein